MNSYVDGLIDRLYKIYNFNIIEIEQHTGVCSKWAVYSQAEDGNTLNVMLFSNIKDYEDIAVEDIIYSLQRSLQNESIKLIQVVIDKKYGVTQDINNPQWDYKVNPHCGMILIRPDLNQVVYCTEDAKNLAVQISGALHYVRQKDRKAINGREISKFIVTYILIALNVLVYFMTSYLSGNIFDSNLNVLVFMGAKVNSLIDSGQYYRLFSCMFLHAGIVHLGVNMYSLYIMGTFIEKIYGRFKYIIIYFISGIISSITSYIFSPSISVGASGAIFGLLGAALIFALKMKHQIGKEFIMNIMSVIAVNLIIGFSIANVDNFGHLGGLVGGIVMSWLLTLDKFS
ncbi:rhomboid family intramembrane serine protease [Clostridium luticellarii]|uniref:Rhomboid protease GluP n=1 Tax=Clostridium luticellarii TaxID=1691940 RepID=A0A2T0BBZ8_9CLOT|nr:rhomboid family intramembrane serine protease [Clostridium luticellarii]PRR81365.1 Rhomboid protease GluP [Clostridium luticellarii]